MFYVGQNLYQVTERDLATQTISPYFTSVRGNGGASTTATGSISIPRDRALYVKNVVLSLGPVPLEYYTNASIFFRVFNVVQQDLWNINSLVSPGLLGQGQQVASVGNSVAYSFPLDILLPPGTDSIDATSVKSGAIAQGQTLFFGISGYLLPAGNIGRA
jgi:hypothetical protein